MKAVQDALSALDIPCYALAWKPTKDYPQPPHEYFVYTYKLFEDEHSDDQCTELKYYVYLNLWTDAGDPGTAVLNVRESMNAAGFAMEDEESSYNADNEQTLVAWTFILRCTPGTRP